QPGASTEVTRLLEAVHDDEEPALALTPRVVFHEVVDQPFGASAVSRIAQREVDERRGIAHREETPLVRDDDGDRERDVWLAHCGDREHGGEVWMAEAAWMVRNQLLYVPNDGVTPLLVAGDLLDRRHRNRKAGVLTQRDRRSYRCGNAMDLKPLEKAGALTVIVEHCDAPTVSHERAGLVVVDVHFRVDHDHAICGFQL